MAEMKFLTCPFCAENGFDMVGLKAHFYRWCEVFDNIPSPEQEQALRRKEKGGSDNE